MSALALALVVVGALALRAAVKGQTAMEAVDEVFQRATGKFVGPSPEFNPQGSGGGGGPDQRGGYQGGGAAKPFIPNVERWRGLVSKYFPAAHVDDALSVIWGESRGIPGAVNPSSRASGLFQHLPQYWESRSKQAGFQGKSIFDPEANIGTAAWLFKGSGNSWAHWSAKPTATGGRVGG